MSGWCVLGAMRQPARGHPSSRDSCGSPRPGPFSAWRPGGQTTSCRRMAKQRFGKVLGGFGPILGWILDELGAESAGALTNLKTAGAESLNRTPALLREASQCAGVLQRDRTFSYFLILHAFCTSPTAQLGQRHPTSTRWTATNGYTSHSTPVNGKCSL